MSGGVPDDLFVHDVQSFPREDPRMVEQRQKMQQQAEKLQKAEEAAAKKAEKEQVAASKAKRANAPPPINEAKAEEFRQAKLAKELALKQQKIRLYFQKLSHKLQMKEPKVYPKTLEATNELLESVEGELASQTGIDSARQYYFMALQGLEAADKASGYQLGVSGPAVSITQAAANSKKDWEDLITECAIANAEWLMFGPVKRTLAFTARLVMGVRAANQAALSQRQQVPISPDLQKEGEDL